MMITLVYSAHGGTQTKTLFRTKLLSTFQIKDRTEPLGTEVYEENCELVIGRTYAYAGSIDDHTHNRALATGLVVWMGGYPPCSPLSSCRGAGTGPH